MNGSFPIALKREYPPGYRLNHQGIIQAIPPDFKMFPVSISNTFPQFRDLNQRGIGLNKEREPSLSSSLFLLSIALNKNWGFQKDLRIRVNTDHIAFPPIVLAPGENRVYSHTNRLPQQPYGALDLLWLDQPCPRPSATFRR